MNTPSLIRYVNSLEDCLVYPQDRSKYLGDLLLPQDLAGFLKLCGGMRLFIGSEHEIEIIGQIGIVRANPVIAVLDEFTGDISDHWYIIANSGGSQYVTTDLNPGSPRFGQCFDSFWDCHAVAGSCPIIALTFSEFLKSLVFSRKWFWLDRTFKDYGDAYAEIT